MNHVDESVREGFRDLGEQASIIAGVRGGRLHDMYENPNWCGEPLFLGGIYLSHIPSIEALVQGPSTLVFRGVRKLDGPDMSSDMFVGGCHHHRVR